MFFNSSGLTPEWNWRKTRLGKWMKKRKNKKNSDWWINIFLFYFSFWSTFFSIIQCGNKIEENSSNKWMKTCSFDFYLMFFWINGTKIVALIFLSTVSLFHSTTYKNVVTNRSIEWIQLGSDVSIEKKILVFSAQEKLIQFEVTEIEMKLMKFIPIKI